MNKRPMGLVNLHGVLNHLTYDINFMTNGHAADVKYHLVFLMLQVYNIL